MIRRAYYLLLIIPSVSAMLLSCGGGNPRYVTAIYATPDETYTAATDVSDELTTLMTSIRDHAIASGVLAVMDETIYLRIDGKVAFTAVIDHGKASFEEGITAGSDPTLVVDVSSELLTFLEADLTDDKLTDEEIFRIASIMWKPCMQRIHSMNYFVNAGARTSELRIDDHMQFGLKNTEKFTFHGEPINISVTALNVDGYFHYIPGFVGDPDVRYEFELSAALELYRRMVYDAETLDPNSKEAQESITKTRAILDGAVTYTRASH